MTISGGGPPDPDWKAVERIVKPLGRMHSLFSSTVRLLADDSVSPSEFIHSFSLMTIARSRKFQTVLYFAARELGFGTHEQLQELSAEELLMKFQPSELAAVAAISYLSHRIQTLCPDEVWDPVRRDLVLQVEVGRVLGESISFIGRGRGLVVGGIRPLAAALFSRGNPHAYIRYGGHLNRLELLYDLEYERETWGCTHLQIFGYMLQQIGFGVHAARAVSLGLEYQSSNYEIEGDADRWMAAGLWIQSLLEREAAPEWLPPGVPSLDSDQLEHLLRQLAYLESSPPDTAWFERKKEELPEPVAKAFDNLAWPSRSRK